MKICEVSTLLAYIAGIYIIACLFYMILTRSYGTPFNDALKNYPDLIKIKNGNCYSLFLFCHSTLNNVGFHKLY